MKKSLLLLPFASALLFWAAHYPLNLGPLAWIALVPLVVYARIEPKRWRALLFAWLGGFVSFSLLYGWVATVFPAGPPGVGLYMGLYWILFVALLRAARSVPLVVAVPAAWVTCEFAWSYVLNGLPYNLIGYTQHNLLAFIQVADLGGIWLVSAIVAAVNGAIARAFFAGPKDRELRLSIAAAVVVVGGSTLYGVIRLATLPLDDGPVVAIIQPNIPQDWKELAKEGLPGAQQREIFDLHVALTREVMKLDPKPDFVCWPESAIFEYPVFDPIRQAWERASIEHVLSVAEDAGVPLAMGVLVYEHAVEGGRKLEECQACGVRRPIEAAERRPCDACTKGAMQHAFIPTNSALLLSPKREVLGRYDKTRLVAFSERIPLPFVSKIVAKLAGLERVYEFRPGSSIAPWSAAGWKIGPEICYEAAYPEISRKFAGNGARICVNLSNEGWFLQSSELDLMFVMARFRAIESRVHYLRATNSGISAFIEPTGRVHSVLEVAGNRKLVKGTLSARCRVTPSGSLFRIVGDVVAWLALLLSLAGTAWTRFRGSAGRIVDTN